jgi:hypothetical protein
MLQSESDKLISFARIKNHQSDLAIPSQLLIAVPRHLKKAREYGPWRRCRRFVLVKDPGE